VSTITAIDTGLTYVTGAATTKSNTISVLTGNSGGWAILAAFAPGTKDCWVVVDIKTTVTAAVTTTMPATDYNAGTYYGVIRNDAAACTATITEGIASANWSSTGFPSG
jgi:hypothetical protein